MSCSREDCLEDMSGFRDVDWEKVPIFPMWVMGQDSSPITDNAVHFDRLLCRRCLTHATDASGLVCKCQALPRDVSDIPDALLGPAKVLMNARGNLRALQLYGLHLVGMPDGSLERDILDKVIAAYGSLKASYRAAGLALRGLCDEEEYERLWPIDAYESVRGLRILDETSSLRRFAALQSDITAAIAGIRPKMTPQEYLRRKVDALPRRDRSASVLRIHIEALAAMTVENEHDVWLEHWPVGY